MFKIDFDVELIESVFKTEVVAHDSMIDLFRSSMYKQVDVMLDQLVGSIQPADVRYANLLLSECPNAINNENDWAATYATLLDLPESMLSSFDFDQFKDNEFGSKKLNQHEFNTILDWLVRENTLGLVYGQFEHANNKYIHAWQNQEPPKPIRGKNGVVAHCAENSDVREFISGLYDAYTATKNTTSAVFGRPCITPQSEELPEKDRLPWQCQVEN